MLLVTSLIMGLYQRKMKKNVPFRLIYTELSGEITFHNLTFEPSNNAR